MVVHDERRLPNLARVVASFARLPHAQYLGMRCDEIGPQRASLSVPYHQRLIGNPRTGVLHGGVITAVLDTVGWLAIAALLPEETAIATLDLRIDYLRPAQPGQTIRATAQCTKITTSVAFARGVAYHESVDNPIAQLSGTYMLGSTGFTADQGGGSRDGAQPC